MGYTLQITSVITVGGMEFTARTIKFYGLKNGELSPAAMELLDWCKLNGFEMVSRPIGKPKKIMNIIKEKYKKLFGKQYYIQ